ncbi:response regulator [Flaviflexus massiliensis]|uniref:response regulator n=1 Tax=Flaviflexus massiliensis TaxID=1522309 RepID=UPI0006D58738|nr:response regulator [Flaviflexus massiliensis]
MTLALLILDDEPEVRDALERDLISVAGTIRVEVASDVDDAWEAIEEIDRDGDSLAVALCDHRMPGVTGVEFLVAMMDDRRTTQTRKVLVTGQADLADTIRAVNAANLDYYMAKPWTQKELLSVVSDCLTDYIEENHLDPLPYMPIIDRVRAMTIIRDRSDLS